MNKLVLLNDIRKENKVNNIKKGKNNSKLNNIINKDYKDFKEKFCSHINGSVDENNSNMENAAGTIKKLFFLENKQPFIDLINFLYDDCLGTNTIININSECTDEQSDFVISAIDDYREFRYEIGIQVYDCSNSAIYIKKSDVNGDFNNVVNFQVKKNLYKKSCDNEKSALISNDNDIKVIVIDSNIEVPDLFQLIISSRNGSKKQELEIFKNWKYDFRKIVENNIYFLAPLKIFDFKKRFIALTNEGYSEKFLKEEILIFFKEINASLSRVKDKGKINDEDIKHINTIAIELFGCFVKDKCFDLSEMC